MDETNDETNDVERLMAILDAEPADDTSEMKNT
jgi:hypothetical protein